MTRLRPGERVVVPFNIACGDRWTCHRQLYAQCETTRVPQAYRMFQEKQDGCVTVVLAS